MFDFACLDPSCARCTQFWDRQLGIVSDKEDEEAEEDQVSVRSRASGT